MHAQQVESKADGSSAYRALRHPDGALTHAHASVARFPAVEDGGLAALGMTCQELCDPQGRSEFSKLDPRVPKRVTYIRA